MTGPRASTTVTRVVGHLSWWVFAVALLMRPAIDGGMPRRYAEYTDDGWAAYTPRLSPPVDGFTDSNILSTVSAAALVVTLGAALAEAVVERRWPAGALTVITPALGAVLVWVGVQAQFGTVWTDVMLRPALAAAIVLAGVAVREIYSRGYAPAARRARRERRLSRVPPAPPRG